MTGGLPGSIPWLVRHELRVTWRGYLHAWSRGGDARRARVRLIWLAVILHLAAAPIALALWMFPVADSPALRLTLTGGLLVVGSLMLSQSLYGVIQSLYMRGDLDLLLSSPLPVGRMLTVRALAVMMNAIGVWALLSLPFVNMLMLFGQFRWISVYPMLFAMGLTATALGLALAMLLFATLGAALTRTTAQVLAALIGVTAFMVSQAQTFLPTGQRAAVAAWAAALPERLGPDSAVWLPARALLGGAGPLLVCIAGAIGLFGLAILAFCRAFAANATAIAGLSTRTERPAKPDGRTRPFRTGLRSSLLRKEWRLLLRDPWLLSQILMQILYLLPLCFIYWRQTQGDRAAIGGLAMMAAVVAGHLAGGLIWITISTEDAPDLLACAPIRAHEVLRAKLLAALLPVGCILAAPLVAIAVQAPDAGLWAVVGCLSAATCATLLGLWYQRPGPRKTFMQRRKGSAVVNIAELLLNFAWGLATALAISGSLWAAAFAAAGLAIMGALRLLAPPAPALAAA